MKAYEDQDFIHSIDGRVVRVLSELLEPKRRLRKHKIEDTLVFFGSARRFSKEQAAAYKDEAEALRDKGASQQEKIDYLQRKAKKTLAMCGYYDAALELSSRLTKWSMQLPDKARRFIVCSGGGPGMMEAANRGAAEKAGGLSLGFCISMPEKFEPSNAYISDDLDFQFHYFFMRKYWFTYLAKALIIFPGGFGTLDELMEILTLKQTLKVKKEMPIVIFGTDYWKDVINFDSLAEWGTIGPKDIELFHFCDTVESAFTYLTSELTRIYLS